MLIFFVIVVVIIIFCCNYRNLSNKVSELEKENMNLKMRINYLVDELSKVNINFRNGNCNDNVTYNNESSEEDNIDNLSDYDECFIEDSECDKVLFKESKDSRDLDSKNIIILTVGAICIVLSAIVFLLSSWNDISNVLKTTILVLLMVMFFGFSIIAKKRLSLDKTSDTFFFIAMAYIPICFLSISFFSLFGDYLSIYGGGRYIYLFISFALTSVIYYYTYKYKNNDYILYGSILSQVLSIIFFSLILENNVLVICINFLLYNILLLFLTKRDTFKKIYNIIPVTVIFISILCYDKSVEFLMVLVLLIINHFYLELKMSKMFNSVLFNILLLFLGIYLFGNYINDLDFRYIFILNYSILVYVIEVLLLDIGKYKNLRASLRIIIPIFLIMLHIRLELLDVLTHPEFVSICLILVLFSLLDECNDKFKAVVFYLIPIYFIISGIDIFNRLNAYDVFYNLLGYITFGIGAFLLNNNINKRLGKCIFNISHIYLFICYFCFDINLLCSLILLGIYGYSFYKTKHRKYKYLSYFNLNVVMMRLFDVFNINSNIYAFIPILVTVIVLLFENIYLEFRDKYSDKFINFIYIVSIIILYIYIFGYSFNYKYSSIVSVYYFTIMISGCLYVFYNIYFKRSNKYNIAPLILSIFSIYNNNISSELSITLASIITLGIVVISINKRRISIYTFASFIYLLFLMDNISNIYLKELIFIFYGIGHYYMFNNEKHKDIFKFISYLGCLFLYNSIIRELELSYTIFTMLGYIVVCILTIRTILNKYIKNIDVLEYITFGMLYLIALINYIDEFDGMIFVLGIIGLLILSYIKKYGSLFVMSVIFILLNIFLLTREFWFSIPWWLYLLLVGAILLVFAIRNEADNKKKEIKIGNIIKNIKDTIEK